MTFIIQPGFIRICVLSLIVFSIQIFHVKGVIKKRTYLHHFEMNTNENQKQTKFK